MTWYYESFKVVPKGWQAWHREYPHIELRWILHVVPEGSKWRMVRGEYGAMHYTVLDQRYLDERFDTWQEAVERAHDLVSTVAEGGFGPRAMTWPQAKAHTEATYDRQLF